MEASFYRKLPRKFNEHNRFNHLMKDKLTNQLEMIVLWILHEGSDQYPIVMARELNLRLSLYQNQIRNTG